MISEMGKSLTTIVGEVFAGKADHHEMEIVAAFFAERPGLLSDLHASKHEVVLGRRGTGKTMVLKHLSFESQMYRSQIPISSESFKIDFAGFYISLALEDQPKEGPEHDVRLGAIFEHWFNLLTLVSVVNVLSELRVNPRLSPAAFTKFSEDVASKLFGQRIASFPEFCEWVTGQEDELRQCCQFELGESVERAAQLVRVLPKLTSIRSFHFLLTKELSELLAPLFNGDPRFYYLLDRFDEVSAARQEILKQAIHVRPKQAHYLKLGVSHSSKLHLSDVTFQDYRILDIEHDVNSPGYLTFCKAVLEKRFAVIRERLRREDPQHPHMALFESPSRLLPESRFGDQVNDSTPNAGLQRGLFEKSTEGRSITEVDAVRRLRNNGKTPIFAGIETFASLSSGCIRIFIEITHRVITHALVCNPSVVMEEGQIPPDLQHDAISIEIDQMFSQELKTAIGATTKEPTVQVTSQRILESLLRAFSKSLDSNEPALHCFRMIGELSIFDERDRHVVDGLLVLDQLGLVTVEKGGVVDVASGSGARYIVSRVFAPKYGVPPIELGCLPMTIDDLHRAADPQWQRAAKATLPLKEHFRCFYATGFREPWENELRRRFRESIFEKLDLTYSDGADEHAQSQQIGRAVGGLISNVDFVIAEISDYNENVCYEMGQCVALELWFYRIRNSRWLSKTKPDPKTKAMLESLKYYSYQFDPARANEGSLTEADWKGAESVINSVVEQFGKLSPAKRKAVNPFDNTHRLGLIKAPADPTVFMFSDSTEISHRWTKDFATQIRDDLKLHFRDDPGAAYQGPDALKYLEAIARSTHCVIDITGKHRFAAFLLGFAVGRGNRHLAVGRSGVDSLITNYRGEAGFVTYDSRDELWSEIKAFLQAA